MPFQLDFARNARVTVTLSEAKGLARPEDEMLRYAQHDKLLPVLSDASRWMLLNLEKN
ncbi:MAG: hypothetical protein M3P30_15580 [Chloroflexota bacterium]|nr:hypothetical protein [Chloroflexota bacterium]